MNKPVLTWCVIFLCSHTLAHAEEKAGNALPEPLSLEAALQLVDDQHPGLLLAKADRDQSAAFLQQQEATDDLDAQLQVHARWIEPAELSPFQSNEDHRAGIVVNKTLYDFGKTSSRVNAARLDLQGADLAYLDVKQRHQLLVMQRYFDVLLADMTFYRYNEEMAVVYIALDRLRQRKGLGQVSDIVIAQQEVEYQKIFRLRTTSQNQQRVTRSLLAQALNRPTDLPASLAVPKLPALERKIPEEQPLLEEVLAGNLVLKNMRTRVEAAQQRVVAAQKSNNPVISAQLEAFAYERETSSTDPWRAGVVVQIPLWTGDRTDAAVASAMTDYHRLSARLAQQEFAIRQQALELWLQLSTLKISREEAKATQNYRELYLDRSRALYEMEVKTDLGDSMVRVSEAQKQAMEADFAMAMVWAKLDALAGKLANDQPQSQVK